MIAPSANRASQSREVRYARRELLGMTAREREQLLDAVIEHLVGIR
ncbi:hypothetical protein [Aurantiacibacter flavus]|uniref:Uncharacterized protein n=1 Tax=Aurantiacibacter flavus TaxID=3145232 RepID=A0ABV0CTA9_9SPHN